MAKDVRYIRGAGGRFQGSTGGGGNFALTGAPKAGGRRAIVARMRERLQQKRLADQAAHAKTISADLRGKARAEALTRNAKLIERLKRNIAIHRREAARAEAGRAGSVRTDLRRVANPQNSRVSLKRVEFIGGKERKPRYVPRVEAGKRDRATIIRVSQSHVQTAKMARDHAKSALAELRARAPKTVVVPDRAAPGRVIRRVLDNSGELRSAEKKLATRERALANRLRELARRTRTP